MDTFSVLKAFTAMILYSCNQHCRNCAIYEGYTIFNEPILETKS